MSGQQLPINVSGIIVAAMLVLAALFNKPPLQSERPPPAKIAAELSGPFQGIPARIWEDPFEAVARTRITNPPDRADPGMGDYLAVLSQIATAPRTSIGIPKTEVDGTSQTGKPVQTTSGEETADSRDAHGKPSTIAEYLAYLVATSPSNPAPRLLVMPVLVSGAPHPAVREMRLRMRVAVHAGLASANFMPLRGDRIGSWIWESTLGFSLEVPYEAFKQDRNGRRIVLLLWLTDEVISRDLGTELASQQKDMKAIGPLAMIDDMLEVMGYPEHDAGTAQAPWDSFASRAVRVIGPASSDSLEAIYAEQFTVFTPACKNSYSHIDNGPNPSPEHDAWKDSALNFMLVSPSATAPATDLVHRDIPDGEFAIPGPKDSGEASERCATLAIHRTVTTDDRLIGELVDELELRGIDPASSHGDTSLLSGVFGDLQPKTLFEQQTGVGLGPRDHVVLISEWDTKFGRTLPVLFDREIRRRWCAQHVVMACPDVLLTSSGGHARQFRSAAGCNQSTCLDGLGISAPWIHRFAYVRGLDGDSPAPANETAAKDRKGDIVSLATGTDAGFKEPAIGTNQYDYLRRLALQIAELDWSLKRDDRGSIKAFGILGNDYYDKLLILQALKERFPSPLYFTTDLDAGYLDAKVFRWTRNLVVAAPFGLTLRRSFDGPDSADLQGMVPPFRHSYQTALYLATLRTLEGSASTIADELAAERPRIFEVGYGRFFDLSRPGGPRTDPGWDGVTPGGTTGSSASVAASLHPVAWDTGIQQFLSSHTLSVSLVLLFGLGLLIAASPSARWRLGTALLGDSYNAPRSARRAWLRIAGPPAGLVGWIERHAALFVTFLYLAIGIGWLLPAIRLNEEPFAWFGGISIWPSEIIRLIAGWMAFVCLIYGWRQVRDADQAIERRFELGIGDQTDGSPATRFAAWYLRRDESAAIPGQTDEPARDYRSLAARICRLFSDSTAAPANVPERVREASIEWRHYSRYASGRARLTRVLPAAILFWLLAFVLVYGFVDPLSPHRGVQAYLFSTVNSWLFVGMPFLVLLFAAVDEALLCSGLLQRLEGTRIRWPVNTVAAGCNLDTHTRCAVNHWVTMEFIAERTAPSANVIHLPFLVILFLLLSLSTRFDNWNTPVSAFGLVLLAIGIGLISSMRLRRTAQRIRQGVLDDLTEEVSGIEYSAARTESEQLQRLVARIQAINEGAYSKWYSEPVFRALAWVFGVGILIVTEYASVGG